MHSNDGSSQDQWDGLPSDLSYAGYNQDEENDFGLDLSEFAGYDDNIDMPHQTGLDVLAIENWDHQTGLQGVTPPWSSEVTFRTYPTTQFQTATLQPVRHSPAAATETLESTPIALFSTGRGTQSVFRAVEDVPRGAAQHPTEVWELHKAEIRRLYMEQQKTLREVIEIMDQRGFRATARMYKKRLDQWRFSKNSKRKSTSGKTHEKANRPGKPPAKDALSLKLNAARKRRPVLVKEEELLEAGMAVYEDHRLLAYLTSPDSPLFREQFMSGIGELSRRHYTLDQNLYRGVIPFLSHILSESRKRVNDLIEASWFFNQKEYEKGRKWAWKAFEMLLDFLQDQNFYSLLYLFISIPRWKDSGLMLKMLNCLDTNANDIMGPNHHLSVLFKQMCNFYRSHGPDEFSAVVSDALKRVFDVIDDMGQEDYCITWLKCDYAWTCDLDELWVNGLLDEVISLRNSLKGGLLDEEILAWTHAMYLHLQVVRQMEGDKSKRTFDVAEDVEINLSRTDSEGDTNAIQALCFRTMAQYHKSLCTSQQPASDPRHGLARHCLKRATIFDEAHWGLGPNIVIQDLKRLEAWNREAERWEEVEAAKVKWVEGMWISSSNTWASKS